MKASTIIKKIETTNTASVAQTELLTKALHREGKLPQKQAIRFRPLFADFDIVNADLFTTGKFKTELCSKIGTIKDLKAMFA